MNDLVKSYESFGKTYVFVDTFTDDEALAKSKKLIKDSGHSYQVKQGTNCKHLYQTQFKTRNW